MKKKILIYVPVNAYLKLKLISICLIIKYYIFIKPIYPLVNKGNDHLIKEYNKYLKVFLNLKEKPLKDNNSLIIQEKENILNIISMNVKKKINSINRIIYTTQANFGNILICLNKIIFFCEIIGCKEITLPKKDFWFLKNTTFFKEFNITINIIDDIQLHNFLNQNFSNSDTVYFNSYHIILYFYKIKSKVRIHLLKDEILKNLPHLNVSSKDLYIHIRSGDIFTHNIHKPYAQPPLCFYISIFKNFNFSKIFLISQDKNNPTIDKILTKFQNVVYTNNKLEYDLSCLMNSYNLVGSISSFLNTIIILNSNLENLWEYNMYKKIQQKIN